MTGELRNGDRPERASRSRAHLERVLAAVPTRVKTL